MTRGIAVALRAGACLGAACFGAAVVALGCAASAEVKFTGTEYPEVPVDEVDDLGEQAPEGFATTGVVTTMCETMNGASGVLEAVCTEAELIALARRQAAAKGGHGLVDTTCNKELLQRTHETLDGGRGVQVTTRERLTCHATVVRWAKGTRPARTGQPLASAQPKPAKGPGDGQKRVMVDDIPIDVAFAPSGSFSKRPPKALEAVGELDFTPVDHAMLGMLAATCAATCAPRHGRAALRAEAARLGGTAIAAVNCEIAGADRWQCKGAVIGDEKATPAVVDAASPEPAPAHPAPDAPATGDAGALDDAAADASIRDASGS